MTRKVALGRIAVKLTKRCVRFKKTGFAHSRSQLGLFGTRLEALMPSTTIIRFLLACILCVITSIIKAFFAGHREYGFTLASDILYIVTTATNYYKMKIKSVYSFEGNFV